MTTTCGSGGADAPDTVDAVTTALRRANERLQGARPRLGLLFASPKHALVSALTVAEREAPAVDWLACSSAGELTDRGRTNGGVAVMLFAWGQATHRLAPVERLEGDVPELASKLCRGFPELMDEARLAGHSNAISIVLGNGLSPRFETAVTEVRRATRLHHTLVGGGAGDDGALERSWVATSGQCIEGGIACAHIASKAAWGVGIGQGPKPRTPRMTVTRAVDNVVYEIDGRSVLDVYREYAERIGEIFDASGERLFLVQHELGIYLFDEVVRVRAGLAVTDDGGILYAGEVPEGSTVAIVCADPDDLIAAARDAAEDALSAIDGPAAGVLLFSCITRGIVLGERAGEEITAVAEVFGRGVPIAGLSSYGEVARVKGKLDGYHNHAIVVVAIPE